MKVFFDNLRSKQFACEGSPGAEQTERGATLRFNPSEQPRFFRRAEPRPEGQKNWGQKNEPVTLPGAWSRSFDCLKRRGLGAAVSCGTKRNSWIAVRRSRRKRISALQSVKIFTSRRSSFRVFRVFRGQPRKFTKDTKRGLTQRRKDAKNPRPASVWILCVFASLRETSSWRWLCCADAVTSPQRPLRF